MQKTLEKFLKMPVTDTKEVFDMFLQIKGAIKRGNGLASFIYIPGTRKDRVLLVAHADTVWDKSLKNSNGQWDIELTFENGIYRNKLGPLGVDDRAGCAIIWLLKDLGHSILITSGEEQGQVGSRFLMEECPDIADEINYEHQFIVQFDRSGSGDYKCYDVGTDEFRSYIEQITGFTEPDRLRTTDIRLLCRNICGVNLSIGYYKEHACEAYLVFDEWLNTLNIARRWFIQRDLPKFKRVISTYEV